MKDRSTGSCCHGIPKLYKSGIYMAVLAEIEIKLYQDQTVKNIKKIHLFTAEISSSICSLRFSDVGSTILLNNLKSLADLYSCLFDIGNSVLFNLLLLKGRCNLSSLSFKTPLFYYQKEFSLLEKYGLWVKMSTLE